MSRYFLDTSALVKYYHAEPGTASVAALFGEPGRGILISSLGLLETQSAFAMKVRSGAATRKAAGIQRARLILDIAAGDIEVYRVTEDHFASAERLLGRYGFTQRLRTLDALQLAVALDLRSQDVIDSFVAADATLLEVAAIEGLRIINPGVAP